MTQQYGSDWQPYRGEKHPPENLVIFNLNNTKDIALVIFKTPLCDPQQDRDAVRGKVSEAERTQGCWKGTRGVVASGLAQLLPVGPWPTAPLPTTAPGHAGTAPAPRGSRLPEPTRSQKAPEGSEEKDGEPVPEIGEAAQPVRVPRLQTQPNQGALCPPDCDKPQSSL